MGDGLLAVFGVPRAHEDDAERAVRAALEMQGILAELDVSMLTILDGWSLLPDAQAAGAVLSSTVAGRAGYLLLEN